jgi:glycosyltransferase involved in cell wall biosynthesis
MRKILISFCELPVKGGTSERIFQIAQKLAIKGNLVTLHVEVRGDIKGINIPRNLQLVEKPIINKVSDIFLNIFPMLAWLVRTYKLGKYDIGQFEGFPIFKALIYFIAFKPVCKKLIFVLHDAREQCHMRTIMLSDKMKLRIQSIILKLFNLIITPAENHAEEVARVIDDPSIKNRLVVIPNGAPSKVILPALDANKLRSKYDLPPNAFLALFFGNLRYKPNFLAAKFLFDNHKILARMFKQITNKEFITLLAGEGSEKFPKTENLIPLGFVENIFEIIKCCDAVVIPDDDYLSAPHVKILYSFIIGKPVILTKNATIGLLNTKNEEHYLIFDINDLNSLVQNLVRIYCDEKLVERISKNCKHYAKAMSWELIARLYELSYTFIST